MWVSRSSFTNQLEGELKLSYSTAKLSARVLVKLLQKVAPHVIAITIHIDLRHRQ